jgi:neutral trehalase
MARAYGVFTSLERHWVEKRCEGGLFHYDTDNREGDWLQQVKYESGWDNSVRFDRGIVELWPADLNAYMVMFYEAMAWIAERLTEDPGSWREKREHLAARIEERLWSEDLQSYCDFNRMTGKFTGVLSPASFVPLFAGISSAERAAHMAKLAADPERFFPGMPTVSYDNREYSRDMWRGPCWLNSAYFAIKGLKRYGHDEVADHIRETILGWCAREGELREYYDAKTGEGLAAVGFGWTAAFVIELILDW